MICLINIFAVESLFPAALRIRSGRVGSEKQHPEVGDRGFTVGFEAQDSIFGVLDEIRRDAKTRSLAPPSQDVFLGLVQKTLADT